MIFVKISQIFYQISLKSLVYLTDLRPQFMACIEMEQIIHENLKSNCICWFDLILHVPVKNPSVSSQALYH